MAEKLTYEELEQKVAELEKAEFKRKIAVDALGESEVRYRSLLNRIQAAVVVHDADTQIIASNPKARELLGLTEDQLLGMTAIDPGWMFLRDDGERMPLNEFPVEQVMSSRQPLKEMTAGICRPRPVDVVWVLIHADPVFDDKGEIQQVIVTFVDITGRKRAEEALRESEARYRELFVSNPHPMWIYDLESLAFLAVNNAAISQYGYSREEFLSMTIKDIRPADDVPRLLDNIDRVGDGLDHAGIWRHIRKDGTMIEVEITSHVLLFDQRRSEMVLVNDITERRRIEKERERLQVQLVQAQKMEAIGTLAGGIAHDFNNMLGVILGHTELALDQMNPAQPLFGVLQDIRKAAERSADLTGQLLAFARKQTVSPRVLDLNEVVERMLKMLRRLIGEDIDLAWIPGIGVRLVKVDPAQIDQILANLCVNARDAIQRVGKVTIETENVLLDDAYCVKHTGFVPGEYVMLAVSDDGCGMDRGTVSKIFEPFFTTKGVGQGTGLGLATVYGVVKQNNGFINVYSEPGKGTTFKIYLPTQAAGADKTGKEIPAVATPRGHETILLVEDEPTLLDMITTMLEHQGYNVLITSSPSEAIRVAKAYAGDIHLLMTDVVMPEMNGRDLAKNLVALSPQLKSLFMSGYTANVIAHHGVLDEGVHFIQKPFSLLDMAAKVREVLDSE